MNNDKNEYLDQSKPNRLAMDMFLMQLDTAENWEIWVNPAFDEVELIVKDSDGKLTAFHGPNPMSVDFTTYKQFCAEVEIMVNRKITGNGEK